MNIIDKVLSRPGPLGEHANFVFGFFVFFWFEGELGTKMKLNEAEKLV